MKDTLERIIDRGMNDILIIEEIDITETSEMVSRYNITTVPTMYLNDAFLGSGYADEETIQQALYQFLLQEVANQNILQIQSREQMINLAGKMIASSLGKKEMRERTGDKIHVKLLQLPILGLRSLDPSVPNLLYNAGLEFGIIGPLAYFISLSNPAITDSRRLGDIYEQTLKGIAEFFSFSRRLNLNYATKGEIKKINDHHTLRIYGLATVRGISGIDEPLDDFIVGKIVGIILVSCGLLVRVRETLCSVQHEEDYCEFEIMRDLKNSKETVLEQKSFTEIETAISKLMQAYTLDEGSNGNEVTETSTDQMYVHMSLLQFQLAALEQIDPFLKNIEYWTGKTIISKEIRNYVMPKLEYLPELWDTIVEAMEKEVRKRLPPFLNMYDSFTVSRGETEKTPVIVRFTELVFSSGRINTQKGICYLVSGMLEGIWSILVDKGCSVNEVMCQSQNHDYCEFEITLK